MKSITLCCLAGMGLCSAAYAYDGRRTDTIFPPAGVIHRDTADLLLRQTATLSGYSVPGSVLSQAPVADVTNSLSGRFPGLYLLQSTGQPGFDAGIFSLRGQSPTILVNGVPRNYTDIDMNDIESVTVLKDAAATALYGARAQGGLLLIKTKRGVNAPPVVSFTSQYGVQEPTRLPRLLNSFDYATLYNEALRNDGRAPLYSDQELEAYRTHSDPFRYPDVNWYDQAVKRSTPFARFNLNMRGGTQKASYFASLSYLDQAGIFKTDGSNTYNTNAGFKRYNLTAGLDIQLDRDTEVGLNVLGNLGNTQEPGALTSQLFANMAGTPPNAYPIFNPDGSLGGNSDYRNNIFAQLNRSGYRTGSTRNIAVDGRVKRYLPFITKGLYAAANVSFYSSYYENVNFSKSFPVFKMDIGSAGDTTYQKFGDITAQQKNPDVVLVNRQFFTQFMLGYDKTAGHHNISGLLLAHRDQVTNGMELPSEMWQFGGRGDYNWKEQVYVQLNAMWASYNYLPTVTRRVFLPSAALAWDVMKSGWTGSGSVISQLKPRIAYGLTANANAGYFAYNQSYVGTGGYTFGNSPVGSGGVTEGSLANPRRDWEIGKKLNAGIDGSFFNDHLQVGGDYFVHRFVDLIQLPGTSSGMLGNTWPPMNLGRNEYRGFEVYAGYRNKVGALHYNIIANLYSEQSKVLFQDEITRPHPWLERTGKPVNAMFGYEAIGFMTEKDITDKTPSVTGYTPVPGDLKFKDQNNDGLIDADDQVQIDRLKPVYYYGVTLGVAWKGFNLNAVLYGTQNRTLNMGRGTYWEFQGLGSPVFGHHLNRWTPETAATADYPRLSAGANPNNHTASSFWIKNGDYIRLKNLQLGYTFTQSWLQSVRLKEVRLFVTGYNLLTSTKLKDFDPESYLMGYPNMRVFNAGLNIKF